MKLIFILFFISFKINLLLASDVKCHITLKNSNLLGSKIKLPNGKFMEAYRGIPYAEPPIGNLRFKPPVPIKKFSSNEIDCTEERDCCLQYNIFYNKNIGSENCLFLNVYKPELEISSTTKLPVMVFIHGGGFVTGSGNSEFYSPEFLVQENVIVITFNYRLGALGFLYLPKAGIHGNAGLYDQLEVFKWILENISTFGGDPENVTIFGESAGGASAHIHFMSPISRKYFHKAIFQSGTIAMDWVLQSNAENKAKHLASLLGCTSTDDEIIYEHLKTANEEKLLELTEKLQSNEELNQRSPFVFTPVIESNTPDSIFTKYSTEFDKIDKIDDRDIPVMMGYNNQEGIFMLRFAKDILKIDECIPLTLNVNKQSKEFKNLSEEIKLFYFGNENPNLTGMVDLRGDKEFINGLKYDLEILKKIQGSSKIFAYRFSYSGKLNLIKNLFNFGNFTGASHGDELFYLFNNSMLSDVEKDSKEYSTRTHMSKMWTNFAKFGDPTPEDDAYIPVKWIPIDNSCKDYENLFLEISNNLEMVKNPDGERFNFWKQIYQKFNEIN